MDAEIPWDRDDGRRGWIRAAGSFEGRSEGAHRDMIDRLRRAGEQPRDQTPGASKRLRKKLVIFAAARAGIPGNWIAEAMGMARSRVQAILAEMEQA